MRKSQLIPSVAHFFKCGRYIRLFFFFFYDAELLFYVFCSLDFYLTRYYVNILSVSEYTEFNTFHRCFGMLTIRKLHSNWCVLCDENILKYLAIKRAENVDCCFAATDWTNVAHLYSNVKQNVTTLKTILIQTHRTEHIIRNII